MDKVVKLAKKNVTTISAKNIATIIIISCWRGPSNTFKDALADRVSVCDELICSSTGLVFILRTALIIMPIYHKPKVQKPKSTPCLQWRFSAFIAAFIYTPILLKKVKHVIYPHYWLIVELYNIRMIFGRKIARRCTSCDHFRRGSLWDEVIEGNWRQKEVMHRMTMFVSDILIQTSYPG